MTDIKDSIEIKASADTIFNALTWIFSSSENYQAWHKDHVTCRWLKGKPFEIGSVLYAEEYLHGQLHKFRFSITSLEPGKMVEFKLLFPASVICPGGSFFIEPKEGGCIFTATLSFNMGWLFSMVIKERVEAIRQHMKEEGENLKMIINKINGVST